MNKVSRLMWIWLPQSEMDGGGPEASEASSDKGAIGLGVLWEEMKGCCYQDIEKSKER